MATKPIHLGEAQSRKADELARRAGTSTADVVNRAVDLLYRESNGEAEGARKFDFFDDPSADELSAAQCTLPIESVAQLRGDFWPEDESADGFTAWLNALRREE